jgi:hypothetical protein
MEISKHIQSFIQLIKAEEQREVAVVKDKVTREKIVPFNQEIDRKKQESIELLNKWFDEQKSIETGAFNDRLAKLQAKYNEDKNIIEDTAEKKKLDNANAVLATATYEITTKCEKYIAKLNSMEE